MDWLELLQTIIELVYQPQVKAADLLSDLLSWVRSEVSQEREVDSELAKLKDTRERICALLCDVERWRSVTEDRVLRWLGDLKDVALHAEDLLEEFESRVALSKNGRKRKRGWQWQAPHSLLPFRRRVAKEIVEIKDRYEAIYSDREKLRLEPGEAPRRVLLAEDPPTGSITPDGFQTLGRNGDRDKLVDLLLRRGGPADGGQPGLLHVVPIYGMAGLGKTTLAKYVFNDDRVAEFFRAEKRIWVCVTRGFDVERITKEILQSLTGRPCDLSNLTVLQRSAREQLGRQPFLLVLDDVRDEGLLYWDNLRACLPAGDGRSSVLITTRSEEVARKMGTIQRGRLNGLPDEDCFSLFLQRACPNGGCTDLREIGFQIAKKCQGSPLAAISLGGLLSGQTDEAEWRSMLEETAAFSQDGNPDILKILRHAYELLPPHLKKCFAFCAVFPAGHQFDKDELVKLWMAEGFIERGGNRRLETMGGRYFDKLLWMSFFQSHCSKYELPVLLHELSLSVSKHEYFRVASDAPLPHHDFERVRHLALCSHNGDPIMFEGFRELKRLKLERLRTFALQGEPRIRIGGQLPSDLLTKLPRLRVLDLGNTDITVLPDSIGELVLLRYLSLYNTLIERLPETVAHLCKLQTLELGECYKLLELPQGISNLTNLRHLGLHLDPHRVSSSLIAMPPGIGKLTSLETLSRFAVGTRPSGCGISEMKNLNLRGELWISKLENVASQEDAREANLKDKHDIETLTLQWSGSDQPDLQYEGEIDVIECLQPPARIKYLRVDGYGGATVPSWMGGARCRQLVSLRLSYCTRWESLPSLEKLPVLKELCIEGMHKIITMDHMFPGSGGPGGAERFPSLVKIRLWDLPEVERWSVAEGDVPQLSELQISHCPKLKDLPFPPSSQVRVLVTSGCEALPALPQDSSDRIRTDE